MPIGASSIAMVAVGISYCPSISCPVAPVEEPDGWLGSKIETIRTDRLAETVYKESTSKLPVDAITSNGTGSVLDGESKGNILLKLGTGHSRPVVIYAPIVILNTKLRIPPVARL